ncbi:2-succinyl-6-hydroxy-2,4-cyclohexadiene-1-carboxylate synthase [Gracilibacillus sp. S3-1-1]|uniref:2-succinyl-6-hydroxy-2, 4-cyclohexadiene-1-carboxylate synthase n=1 Tax=Gracilibacillus pellucidus TaxID=3095368 RepID=A0ACC6M1N1_9BACI|nr:2-succinyl-6-hydroxy-2,4-cyclohexadiene-1-carboxylate synthase [Gracilibacillus sp. S3-1-1]MDX8044792.1 2-succinyl-6-hydroxy-2,4-cyclohexadiene-1-carboxylate synthase [Gracilibacillus sp. S3-1-1]
MYINDYWIETYGEGRPVVFLHGFTGSSQTWQSVRPFFSSYQFIVVDLPGHGYTKARVKSMKDCCEDLSRVFKEMGLELFDLVGYSMGGRTALSFACAFPEMVRTLTLESASPGLKVEQERIAREQRDQRLAEEIVQYPLALFVDKWENIALFDSQKRLPKEKRDQIREERMAQSREGLAHSLVTMGTGVMGSYWDKLERLGMPVLLVTGEWDEKFIDINKKMDELLPDSHFTTINQAGHAIHVEQTKKFGTIVEEFISKGGLSQ